MRDLAGQPLVSHIFDRLKATPGVGSVILATTADPRNDPLVTFARDQGILIYREENENDIVARLLGAANVARADAILKVNGDCPLVDPAIMQQLIDKYGSGSFDYVSNKILWSWPEGYSAEIIAADALEICSTELTTPADRELVANYIRDNGNKFRVGSVGKGPYGGTSKLAVDTPEDFEEVAEIFDALWPNNPCFGFEDVIEFLDRRKTGLQWPRNENEDR